MPLKDLHRNAQLRARGDDGRLRFLVNDMVIEEQLCQLRCSYCLTEDFNLLLEVPDARERLTTDNSGTWLAAVDHFDHQVDAPIMRVSGGELFWLPGSTEFVLACADRYETVQVITNGVFLDDERLDRLAERGNVLLNVSLDGHTNDANRHRLNESQSKLVPHIISRMDRAVELGIKVDVQSVLTDANAAMQHEFCDFLLDRYGDAVMLFFFPVRGDSSASYMPADGRWLDPVLERFEELSPVLPPRAYVEHMNEHLATGRRSLQCSVVATMGQLFGDGEFSACPHAWVDSLGNVDSTDLTGLFANHPHYEIFLQDRPRAGFCKGCATPSDIVNLYFADAIDEDDVARCFLYSGPRSMERITELKRMYTPALEESARRREKAAATPVSLRRRVAAT